MTFRGRHTWCFVAAWGLLGEARAQLPRDLVTRPLASWSEEAKKSFRNHFTMCTDKSWVAPVNLSFQFPNSECQGNSGTCAPVATAGLFSAALHRADFARFGNRQMTRLPGYTHPALQIVQKGALDSRAIAIDRSLGAKNIRVQRALRQMQQAEGCDDILKRGIGATLLDGDAGDELITSILCGATACPLMHPRVEHGNIAPALSNALVKMCEEKKLKGEPITEDDLIAILRTQLDRLKIPTDAADGMRSKQTAADALVGTFYRHRIFPGTFRKKTPKSGKGCREQGAKGQAEALLNNIRQYLCAQIPILAGLDLGAVPGRFESRDPGQDTYSSVTSPVGAWHAMVVTGVYTHVSGQAYIEFRNSQTESWSQAGDIFRIPVEEACHLTGLTAVLSPDDRARLALVGADLSASKDYEEVAPGAAMQRQYESETERRKNAETHENTK